MKKILIGVISLYQQFISPALNVLLGQAHICRFAVTCSEYTKHQIAEHGILSGLILGLRRILSCHPYGSFRKHI